MDLSSFITDVVDFPKPGIVYKDITPLLKYPPAFDRACTEMRRILKTQPPISKIVAIEARGFIFGSVLAWMMEIPLVLARKAGKLPRHAEQVSYKLEYGEAVVEIHGGDINKDDFVLIVDDVLATGGTANAVARLIGNLGATPVALITLLDLKLPSVQPMLIPCFSVLPE